MKIDSTRHSATAGLHRIARAPIAAALLIACAAPALAQGDDPLMSAMRDEMKRSAERLRIESADAPYFIQYSVADVETWSVDATFGALTQSEHDRRRSLRTEVRVGSYQFDNSGFIRTTDLFSGGDDERDEVVIDDDYNAIRRDLWLATDLTYKSAIGQIAGKRAARQNRIEKDTIPDFSREEPTTMIAPKASIAFDSRMWEERVREWSAIFRKYPEIQESSVELDLELKHTYIVTSEGTTIRQPQILVSIEARATAQADDGMQLARVLPIRTTGLDALPPADEIARSITTMADELRALRSAPVFDGSYAGPVLFTGQGAAEMFAQLLGANISGERPSEVDRKQLASFVSSAKSELADRLNRRVLPSNFTVIVDPTQEKIGSIPLIGSYKADDQGVPARGMTIVESGVLKGLLMSRRPRKDLPASNGHARSGGSSAPSPQVSNMIVQGTNGRSYEELKKELIEQCRVQSLPYGIIIKALATPDETPDDGERQLMFFGGGGSEGGNESAISAPILAYRVYQDGREELVRGAAVSDITVRSLRDIVAVGSDQYVWNRMERPRGAIFDVRELPMSVAAPSVIFEELEIKRAGGEQQKPALLTHPFFTGR